ncbi:MAG: hypothetical protein M1820_004682 [Bogoriella megaspora]|nr:MAG: hypothetical protein M1820_004682 [Bogoriella megaspora]
MTNFQIDIISDVVCPWCYVGKTRLEKAISHYRSLSPSNATDTFTTTWSPFYLNPDAPRTGIDKQEYYRSKFGAQRTAMIFQRLSAIGAESGINFKYGGKTGNTRDAHRVVQLAKEMEAKGDKGRQTRVVEELFRSYFEEEGDITDRGVLTQAAVKAGLEEGEVKEWLETDGGGKLVDREVEEAQMRMIHGVPHFTIQGLYEVGGAEDPAVFVEIFEKIKGKVRSNGAVKGGETC